MKAIMALLALVTCEAAAQDFTRSEEFFSKFAHSDSAWREWGSTYYNDERESATELLIQHSKDVRDVLQYDYGLVVPFDPDRAREMSYTIFTAPSASISPAKPGDCGAVTALLLGSMVSATLGYADGGIARQSFLHVSGRNNIPLPYIARANEALKHYCFLGGEEQVAPVVKDFTNRLHMSLQDSAYGLRTAMRMAAVY
ncbi:hypothetical protein HNP46_006501 [Pseudomonas nitritireducens]|uniref:Uncharacterized protein n=1 Tax=Pseudomonas nitroreducens TaxID=46680 RepID=A0A7W7KRL8_PSENT|nr:hypothetical protein [Pseudomonas nitritireducens]MBB4867587.1 hypothetical protein [Pseudomonas nitritireducens]